MGSRRRGATFEFAAIAVLLLSACNQQARDDDAEAARANGSGVITKPDTSVDEVAWAEPGKDRHQWDAADGSTRAITGNLTASVEGRGGPLMLAFATGITEQGERDVRVSASEQVGGTSTSFASVLHANADASVFLYRVANEDIASVARNGGLCGAARTTFLAATEYVSSKGDWVLRVAAFRGPNPPNPGAEGEPLLCGVYYFAAP